MPKGSRICAVAALTLVLAGCAASSVGSLRSDPGRSGSFHVSLPYEQVYENEQRGFLACMTGSNYQFEFVIRPRLNTAKRTASIALLQHGLGPDYWALVDIVATADGSIVSAYTTSHPLMRDFVNTAHGWAVGNPRCPKFSILTGHFPASE